MAEPNASVMQRFHCIAVVEEAVKYFLGRGGTKREQCMAVYMYNIYVCAGHKSWGARAPYAPCAPLVPTPMCSVC